MEEVMKRTDHYFYLTSTAEVTSTDDFVVELFAESQDRKMIDVIKINNIDELMDFLEKTGW
jgi:hypothetical protein